MLVLCVSSASLVDHNRLQPLPVNIVEARASSSRIVISSVSACPCLQVARQQGHWLAKKVFTSKDVAAGNGLPDKVQPFIYSHKGSLAYVGQDRAVMDMPKFGPLFGLRPGNRVARL